MGNAVIYKHPCHAQRACIGSCTTVRSAVQDHQFGKMSDIDKIMGSVGHLADKISVQTMRNGAVAFEDEAAASVFRDHLEAEGHLDVLLSDIDSHSLFRTMQDARSVVVLLRSGGSAGSGSDGGVGFVPTPAQLAAELRQKRSLEEM